MNEEYLIALGSNRRHHLYGRPSDVVRAAMEACARLGAVKAHSRIIETAPIGPAQRRFANAACIIQSEHNPIALLTGLKQIENQFGRRRGKRWGDRVIDLDIVLWSGGTWSSPELCIPHREMRQRDFVLGPASTLADRWRDPVSGLGVAQLLRRLKKPRKLK